MNISLFAPPKPVSVSILFLIPPGSANPNSNLMRPRLHNPGHQLLPPVCMKAMALTSDAQAGDVLLVSTLSKARQTCQQPSPSSIEDTNAHIMFLSKERVDGRLGGSLYDNKTFFGGSRLLQVYICVFVCWLTSLVPAYSTHHPQSLHIPLSLPSTTLQSSVTLRLKSNGTRSPLLPSLQTRPPALAMLIASPCLVHLPQDDISICSE